MTRSKTPSQLPPLTKNQRSIVAACALGDLYIEKRERKKGPVFLCRGKQSWKHTPYIESLLASFEGFQSSKGLILKSEGCRPGNLGLPKAYYFGTKSDMCGEGFHRQVYILKVREPKKVVSTGTGIPEKSLKKGIPTNLDIYFQGVDMNIALAYLFMDKGVFHQKRDSLTYGHNCFLSLTAYSQTDLLRFSKFLNQRFNGNTSVRKKKVKSEAKVTPFNSKITVKGVISIPVADREDFFSRICEHVIPHFYYKLPVQFRA